MTKPQRVTGRGRGKEEGGELEGGKRSSNNTVSERAGGDTGLGLDTDDGDGRASRLRACHTVHSTSTSTSDLDPEEQSVGSGTVPTVQIFSARRHHRLHHNYKKSIPTGDYLVQCRLEETMTCSREEGPDCTYLHSLLIPNAWPP